MNENIEIEIRVKVEKLSKLRTFLKKNANFVGEKHQIDRYYVPAHRNFLESKPISEWLRLRDSSGKFSITYKNWHFDKNDKSNYCDEYETKVESLEQLEKIFERLNMKEIVVVDKVRNIYLFQDYEISLDTVKGLGEYVEIEYKGMIKDQKPLDVANSLMKFLKGLDCGKIQRVYVGYPQIILFPEEVVFEEQ